MNLIIELDEDQTAELLERFIKTQEENDSISSLSIIFGRYDDGFEPTLFFCPDWPFSFEVRLTLEEALQDYLADETGDAEEHMDLVRRLLAVIDDWKKEQTK